jgi:hypothetical protein
VKLFPLHLALFAFAVGVFAQCAPVEADAYTEQEVALGKLCWNEASTNRNDCIAIVESRGHLTLPELQAMHRRALAPVRTDGRRWISGLSADISRSPEHWPEDRVPWNPRGAAMWSTVLETVRATLRGELSVCSETPSVWGGPMDRERIDRILARGGRVVCTGTRNVFLRFGGGR